MPKLKEGTPVKILRCEVRPEFNDKMAEIGNFSEKDDTYEVWLTDDAFEGSYAVCKPDDLEVVDTPAEPDIASTMAAFGVGDRVRGKETGAEGIVTAVDADGDPKVQIDGEDESVQRFGKEFEVIQKATFGIGDRVMGKETGSHGTVVSVDEDGDPKVILDGEAEPLQRFAKEFEIVEKFSFGIGDRVRGKESGKMGTVTSIDADGDPKVQMDGESETLQRYAKEFEFVEKAGGKKGDKRKSKSSSSSGSESSSEEKKKKKKKRKRSSSSTSDTRSRMVKKRKEERRRDKEISKKSAFGMSVLEKKEEEKRKIRMLQKKSDDGANAALRHLRGDL